MDGWMDGWIDQAGNTLLSIRARLHCKALLKALAAAEAGTYSQLHALQVNPPRVLPSSLSPLHEKSTCSSPLRFSLSLPSHGVCVCVLCVCDGDGGGLNINSSLIIFTDFFINID